MEHMNPDRATEWAETYGNLGAVQTMRLAMLPLNILDFWTNPVTGGRQPFHSYPDDELQDLAENIRKNGVIEPICVRPMPNNRFQIIAGEHRTKGSRMAGKATIPAVIRQLSDDEATILMVDSNLKHRKKLLPSDKAWAYRLRLEAMNRSGKRHPGRPKNNYSHGENNFPNGAEEGSNNYSHGETSFRGTTTSGELAEAKGVSKALIFRYIRLTYLIQPLLDLVDQGKFALQAAVEISYLDEDSQARLLLVMEDEPCKAPSLSKAKKLRAIFNAGELDEDAILAVMVAPKNEPDGVKLPMARIARFFPAHAPQELILSTIEAALEAYIAKEKAK